MLKGEFLVPIAKRAYRHLQSHPYFSILMIGFYLVYFIFAFIFALLIKQFSDSYVQLTKIIASLDSQQVSFNSRQFKILESITTHYIVNYRYIFFSIILVGTLIVLMIQLWLSQARKKEYQSYLLLGERVYKLTAQLIMEQLLLINCVLLLIFACYSLFKIPIMNQITQIEATSLQSKLEDYSSIQSSQEGTISSDSESKNFTRFNVNPFLKGEFINNKFSQTNTLIGCLILIMLNLYSAMIIGIPNYIVLSLRKSKLS